MKKTTTRCAAISLLALSFTATSYAKDCAPAEGPFCFYGFLMPMISLATEGVESFSQPNQSAFTAAANPAVQANRIAARSSFQIAQSRMGFVVKPEPKTSGRLEFDFIDFSKASPTTAALPRVRRALIEHALSETTTLRFGQDWDLVSPLAPHSYNLVGHYFQSGDVAFMRIQAQLLAKSGDWEHAIAIGLPGSNNGAMDGLLELGVMPTFAVRESVKVGVKSKLALSAIATQLRRNVANGRQMFAGALMASAETAGEAWELRSEAYLGQNTFNLGMLGLAFGNDTLPAVKEAGAFVTAKYKPDAVWSLFAGVGGSFILDPNAMLSSYTGATPALAGTGPGLERNLTARVGGEYFLTPSLNFFAEFSGLFSRHHLQAAELAKFSKDVSSWVMQTGLFLAF